jgi:hypothetical protein
VPRLLRTTIAEPTTRSRLSWTAPPYRFRLVALAGIAKGHFRRSLPDNPIDALSCKRLLRRLDIRLGLGLSVGIRCELYKVGGRRGCLSLFITEH